MRRLALALALAAALVAPARADERDPIDPYPPVVLPGTEVQFVQAKSNGVAYKLYVALPKSYRGSKKTYPLVLTLDADYSFPIVKSVAEHLADRDGLPEVLLAGIAYAGPPDYRVNRTRDYTPTRSLQGYAKQVQAHSGGSAAFRAFVVSELIPLLARRYRTTPDVTLVGHSYGGLFASGLLLDPAPAFRRLVIVSPSLWYDHHWLPRQAQAVKPAPDRGVRVYVGSGGLETGIAGDVQKFATEYRRLAGPRGHVLTESLPDENHDTVFPAALTRGLRFVFERWP